jgi:hypothetical protein
VHVLLWAVHELADDDAVGLLRGVEVVPEGVDAAVRADAGRGGAEPHAVVWSLAAARDLGGDEAVGRRVGDEVHVHPVGVDGDEDVGAELRVDALDHVHQLRVVERGGALQLGVALPVAAAPQRQLGGGAPQRARPRDQHPARAQRVELPQHLGVLGHDVAHVVRQRELAGPRREGHQVVVVDEVVAAEGDEHERAADEARGGVLADEAAQAVLVLPEVAQLLLDPDDVGELDARVVEHAHARRREVGAHQQLPPVQVRAQVRQRRLRAQVLADDVRHVLAVGEAACRAVRRVVEAVRRRVGARRRGQVVVVAAVHQRVAEDEEGAGRGRGGRGRCRAHLQEREKKARSGCDEPATATCCSWNGKHSAAASSPLLCSAAAAGHAYNRKKITGRVG